MKEFKIKKGPVLVTGANSGIGLATCLECAKRGITVWGTVRSQDKAELLATIAYKNNLTAFIKPLVLDVSDVLKLEEKWKDLPDFYAIVNNAGYSETGAIEDVLTTDMINQVFINLLAPATIARLAIPGMRRIGSGRIIMVSSIFASLKAVPLSGWYLATKTALNAISNTLRIELLGSNIYVSIVEPGFTSTNILSKAEDTFSKKHFFSSRYSFGYNNSRKTLKRIQKLAMPASVVGKAIVDIIEDNKPKEQIIIGKDTSLMLFIERYIPDFVKNKFYKKILGL